MKMVCFRTWGWNRNDWGCSIHPTSEWRTYPEQKFEKLKSDLLATDLEEHSSTLEIEWMYAGEGKSRRIRRGWVDAGPSKENGEPDALHLEPVPY